MEGARGAGVNRQGQTELRVPVVPGESHCPHFWRERDREAAMAQEQGCRTRLPDFHRSAVWQERAAKRCTGEGNPRAGCGCRDGDRNWTELLGTRWAGPEYGTPECACALLDALSDARSRWLRTRSCVAGNFGSSGGGAEPRTVRTRGEDPLR